MDRALEGRIASRTKKGFRSRAEFIRAACEHYLAMLARAEADRCYVEGYERHPEETTIAKASAKLAGTVLPAGEWS